MIQNEIWVHPYWLFNDAEYITSRLDLLAGRASHLVVAWHSNRGASGRSELWQERSDNYSGLNWLEFICHECAERDILVVPRFPIGGSSKWFGTVGKRVVPLPTWANAANIYGGEHPDWINLLDPATHAFVLEAVAEFFHLNAHLMDYFADYAHIDYARMDNAVPGISFEDGCPTINSLVRNIKNLLPPGWALDGTYSTDANALQNTYRDPVTLMYDGTLRRIKGLNYTVPASDRLARIAALDGGPDWPTLAHNYVPGIGTDPALGATITPAYTANERDILQAAGHERLYWFVLGTGSGENPERMTPEMIGLIPELEGDGIMAAIEDLQVVEAELRAQAAAVVAQADAIAAVIVELTSVDAQADALADAARALADSI